ncbi:hypothetical protein AC249_AIPGENE11297 [Exaiptasia diaphana]|nr:hypothetical protein AC249_AIPGENE11297 [Exaiptasia diaphana]
MTKANKPVLAEAMWVKTKNDEQTTLPAENVRYVLDGGALLHRVIWPRGVTYREILSMYNKYVMRRYGQAIVVFDGYEEGPSTKDCAHQRRAGISSPPVNFDCGMVLTMKKEEFLRNPTNKQKFIYLLAENLRLSGCDVLHSTGDADLMIVQAAISDSQVNLYSFSWRRHRPFSTTFASRGKGCP